MKGRGLTELGNYRDQLGPKSIKDNIPPWSTHYDTSYNTIAIAD